MKSLILKISLFVFLFVQIQCISLEKLNKFEEDGFNNVNIEDFKIEEHFDKSGARVRVCFKPKSICKCDGPHKTRSESKVVTNSGDGSYVLSVDSNGPRIVDNRKRNFGIDLSVAKNNPKIEKQFYSRKSKSYNFRTDDDVSSRLRLIKRKQQDQINEEDESDEDEVIKKKKPKIQIKGNGRSYDLRVDEHGPEAKLRNLDNDEELFGPKLEVDRPKVQLINRKKDLSSAKQQGFSSEESQPKIEFKKGEKILSIGKTGPKIKFAADDKSFDRYENVELDDTFNKPWYANLPKSKFNGEKEIFPIKKNDASLEMRGRTKGYVDAHGPKLNFNENQHSTSDDSEYPKVLSIENGPKLEMSGAGQNIGYVLSAGGHGPKFETEKKPHSYSDFDRINKPRFDEADFQGGRHKPKLEMGKKGYVLSAGGHGPKLNFDSGLEEINKPTFEDDNLNVLSVENGRPRFEMRGNGKGKRKGYVLSAGPPGLYKTKVYDDRSKLSSVDRSVSV